MLATRRQRQPAGQAIRVQSSESETGAELVIEAVRRGNVSAIYHVLDDGDVDRIMRHPQTMIASDGRLTRPGEGHPHPRWYGTFPRVLARYVRELEPEGVARRRRVALVALAAGGIVPLSAAGDRTFYLDNDTEPPSIVASRCRLSSQRVGSRAARPTSIPSTRSGAKASPVSALRFRTSAASGSRTTPTLLKSSASTKLRTRSVTFRFPAFRRR